MKHLFNLGCGGKYLSGYINVDIRPQFRPDVVADICRLPFPDGVARVIRMDAVYEHIYPHKRRDALGEWYRTLEPDGQLIINWIPDFEALLNLYGGPGPTPQFPRFDIEMAHRMCNGAAAMDEPSLHKDIFTCQKVMNELLDAGFVPIHIARPIADGESLAYNICVEAYKS